MNGQSSHVGAAIEAAVKRAEELRTSSLRKLRVRIVTVFEDGRSGLTIHARIASRTPAESRAQAGLGVRSIPWLDLDQRAHELVGLVEDAIAEVTLAVDNAPQCYRLSHSASDRELQRYEQLVDDLGRALSQTALKAASSAWAEDLPRNLTDEATMAAAVRLAALAAYSGNMGRSDAEEELALAIGGLLNRTDEKPDPRSLN
ncbi:hypothetical protein [Neoaquamicrobium sediminum]|uniref:hypothetical protein n=1 Tax=Neoaquamicrobium sediminum TaxID=1849104 RepID=UPI001566A597|nr:hypothetical protein [Mesorhizobium sediminum]NRC57191.1 hypothetical protein [Mesorhizobium sediminum]